MSDPPAMDYNNGTSNNNCDGRCCRIPNDDVVVVAASGSASSATRPPPPPPPRRPVVIRLDEPRPSGERSQNEYVLTTKAGEIQHSPPPPPPNRHHHRHRRTPRERSSTTSRRTSLLVVPPPGRVIRIVTADPTVTSSTAATGPVQIPSTSTSRRLVIVDKQPRSSSSTKYGTTLELVDKQQPYAQSIICKRCGRCRCKACAEPRQLPSRWICGDHCLLSPRSIVDTASCMCCVKGFLYHAAGGGSYPSSSSSSDLADHDDDAYCMDQADDCCLRWTTLVCAFSFLPCLWFYLPLRLCAAGLQAAYVKLHDNGCRCGRGDQQQLPVELLPSMAAGITKDKVAANSGQWYLQLAGGTGTGGVKWDANGRRQLEHRKR